MERPIPYRGKEGYIFISYAHKDSDRVWPIIQQMIDAGYRVWYDDGIDPGSEWDENIAAHVSKCGYFLAFLSENYLASNNCKDELNFSRDQGKPQLLIYLEDVELPQGMAMRLGRNQAIFENRYTNKSDFFKKLYESQGIRFFQEGNQTEPSNDTVGITGEKTTQQAAVISNSKKSKKIWMMPLAVAVVLAVLVFLFFGKGNSSEGSIENSTEENGNLDPVTNVVLVDNEQLKITALKTAVDSRYYTLSLAVENKGRSDLYLEHDDFYLNGVACETTSGHVATSKDVNLIDIQWKCSVLEKYGIDPQAVTIIEAFIGGRYMDNSGEIASSQCVYYPYGEEHAKILTYIPAENDVILADTEDYLIVARGDFYDEENGSWNVELVCVNRSDEKTYFTTEDDCINNYRVYTGLAEWVWAGRMKYCNAEFSEFKWKTTGYEKVLHYSGKINTRKSSANGQEEVLHPFEFYPEGENAAIVISQRQLAESEILWEDEWVRAAYLGSLSDGYRYADLFYFCNLTEEYQEIAVSIDYEDETIEDGGQTPVYLEGGEEAIEISYRGVSAGDYGMPAKIWVGVWAVENGEFMGHFKDYTENDLPFTVYDPEE